MKLKTFLWIVFLGFLLTRQTTLAADQCETEYGPAGLVCVEDQNTCQTTNDAKNTVQTLQQSKNVGVLGEGSYSILSVCTGNSVCCLKQQAPASGDAAPAAGTGSGTGDSIKNWIESNPAYTKPAGYDGPIPDCGFSGTCTDVNDLVGVLIKQGKMIFGLIGMVALASFVYGGFLMVFSFGSSDKIQQGKDVMVAAVIGIVIVFSAYIIVNFVLNTLGVSADLQAIK